MKKNNILKWVILAIAVAINVFIIVNAFINGEASAKESTTVARKTADVINYVKEDTITPAKFPTFAAHFRKVIGHFFLFILSGVFTSWSLHLFVKETKLGYFAYQVLMLLVFGFFLATFTELSQKFTDGRVGAWTDVGIDMMGYFIGVLLVFLILLILKSPIYRMKKARSN